MTDQMNCTLSGYDIVNLLVLGYVSAEINIVIVRFCTSWAPLQHLRFNPIRIKRIN